MGIAQRIAERFNAWRLRPRNMSAGQVAALLRKFEADTAAQSEWDFFCTGGPLADPRLDMIRDEVAELFGPRVEPYTTQRLAELATRAEAIDASGDDCFQPTSATTPHFRR